MYVCLCMCVYTYVCMGVQCAYIYTYLFVHCVSMTTHMCTNVHTWIKQTNGYRGDKRVDQKEKHERGEFRLFSLSKALKK